jgi:Tfp pilus assembly protein PilF
LDEAVYGSNHSEVAIDISNLGLVLRDQGDRVGARAHFERALRILQVTYGTQHPKTQQVESYLRSL